MPLFLNTGFLWGVPSKYDPTEAKKRGYARAAREYEKAIVALEEGHRQAQNLLYIERGNNKKITDVLIHQLEGLEREVEQKRKAVAQKYNVSPSQIGTGTAVLSGALVTLIFGGLFGSLLGSLERKVKQAEQQGYLEAKEIYEKKIASLKNKLQSSKEDLHLAITDFTPLIDALLSAIGDKKIELAELNILLLN